MLDVGCSMFDVQSLIGSMLDVQNSVPVIKKMNRFTHPFDKLRTSSAKRKAKRNPDLPD